MSLSNSGVDPFPAAGGGEPPVHPSPLPKQNGTNNQAARGRAAGKPNGAKSVPPPPPYAPVAPRAVSSSLVPNSATNNPAKPRTTGVGSARSIAWRDELPEATDDDRDEDDGIKLEREAPSWLISLVIHLTLLLVLALIYTPYGQKMTTIVLEIGNAPDQGDELESFELDMAEPLVSESMDFDVVDPTMEPVEMPRELLTNDSLIELPTMAQTEITSMALPTTGMLSGRSGASKAALLAAYGGTQETEDAVQAGLRWLARQQQKDGSWSLEGPYQDGGLTDNRLAATAMALLAFQGNGNTHLSGPYKENVDKGLTWLLNKQDRQGFMGVGLPRHEKHYAQAQASIVLCELYGMTKDSRLRDPAQRAIKYAESSQHSGGGWRYEVREEGDTSVTGWFVMTLQSGRAAGLDVDASKLRIVNAFLDSVQHAKGAAYGYQQNGGPSKAMTAEGLLCRQYLGWPRESEAMAMGVNALIDQGGFDISDRNYYYWYYGTQVMHHYGGSPWREWNSKMRVELPNAQTRAGAEAGSWSPQRSVWGGRGGRLYTTCMAIYCLEVYYRHMPLYDLKME